jgi:PIN domain nuclease of toxin-antitoxin system
VAYKPRNKRLSPQKVRANLLAQQVRLAQASTSGITIEQSLEKLSKLPIPKDVIIEAQDRVTTRITQISTEIHTQLQAAAEIHPDYRPLIGRDAKETMLLVKKHKDSLSEEERKAFSRQFKELVRLTDFDPIEFLGSVFLAGSGKSWHNQEPSAALYNNDVSR